MIIFILLVIFFLFLYSQKSRNDENHLVKPFEKNDINTNKLYNKYDVIIKSILKDPVAKLTLVNDNYVLISSKLPNTYSEFKIRENQNMLIIEWVADLSYLGKYSHIFSYTQGTSQILILDEIENYMKDLTNIHYRNQGLDYDIYK